MSRVTVCVLVLDGWAAAEETLASIRRLGLNAAAGLIGNGQGPGPDGVEVHRLEWRDDFGHARNQLASRVMADWLLWLDDDEKLEEFDEAAFESLDHPFAAIQLKDRPGYTSRTAVRLQRRRADVRWVGAVHESLTADHGGPLVILDSIRVYRFAHEDPRLIRARLGRNDQAASRARARGDDGFGVTLAEAWSAEAVHGPRAMTAWLRAFKHRDAGPFWPGAPDPRIKVAEWLCVYNFTKPALQLLEDNPMIVGLRFHVLAYIWCTEGRIDETHFNELVNRLATGRFDRRYSTSCELMGIGRKMLRGAVEAHVWTRYDLKARNRVLSEPSREGRYLVAPAGLRVVPWAPIVIRIDAGLTFGSGAHPASSLCLRALDWLARDRKFRRILDVGVGSGILSIAAAKTWPACVTAVEVNPYVAAKARHNILANMVALRVRVMCHYGGKAYRLPRDTHYDLALVNLKEPLVVAYAPALARCVMPRGVVVLSGLGTYKERYVAGVYRSRGFVLRIVFRQAGFSTLVMEARPAERRPKDRGGAL